MSRILILSEGIMVKHRKKAGRLRFCSIIERKLGKVSSDERNIWRAWVFSNLKGVCGRLCVHKESDATGHDHPSSSFLSCACSRHVESLYIPEPTRHQVVLHNQVRPPGPHITAVSRLPSLTLFRLVSCAPTRSYGIFP